MSPRRCRRLRCRPPHFAAQQTRCNCARERWRGEWLPCSRTAGTRPKSYKKRWSELTAALQQPITRPATLAHSTPQGTNGFNTSLRTIHTPAPRPYASRCVARSTWHPAAQSRDTAARVPVCSAAGRVQLQRRRNSCREGEARRSLSGERENIICSRGRRAGARYRRPTDHLSRWVQCCRRL